MSYTTKGKQLTYREADEPATRGEVIIGAAIASLDFSKYKTAAEVEQAVLKRVSFINTRFMSPRSNAMKMLDSVRIYADVISVEYEESSTRMLATFKQVDSEQTETIRSERTDGYGGDETRQLWESAVGKRAYIYKYLEEKDGRKYRFAPYIDILS